MNRLRIIAAIEARIFDAASQLREAAAELKALRLDLQGYTEQSNVLGPHRFTGITEGVADRPCTTCGLPDRAEIHKGLWD